MKRSVFCAFLILSIGFSGSLRRNDVDQYDEEQRNEKKQQGHRPKGAVVFCSVEGISHVGSDDRGQCTSGIKKAFREGFRFADDHGYGQRFAERTRKAQDDPGYDTAARRRNYNFVNHLPPGRAEAVSGIVKLLWNTADRVGAYTRNGREDHERQYERGRKNRIAVRQVKQIAHGRHEDRKTCPAIDDRRDADKDLDCALQHPVSEFRGDFRHENRRSQTERCRDKKSQSARKDRPHNESGGTDCPAFSSDT